jgi:glycosyltransferase involved in cell wall biosynthesis
VHVLQISFFVDPQRRPPERLLADWHSLEDIATAVASAGERVTVVQASLSPGALTRRGIDFVFISPGESLARSDELRALLRHRPPDVVHVHGLGFPRDVLALRELMPNVPILLQDHGNRVPRLWRRPPWRRAAAAIDGIAFCALPHAERFVQARLMSPRLPVFEIAESTSSFMPGDMAAARAVTGVRGDPALLWVGGLDRRKDPLTVLDGVAAATRDLPRLELWCCFSSAPLLAPVEARIARDRRLRDRVHLLGRVPHGKVEQLMRAADLFVLGSHREGSCFALIEALATGLTPVVTDIPSLRMLTGNGAVGELWQCGDSHSLTAALHRAVAAHEPCSGARARAHFEAHLSSTALGRRFAAAYRELAPRPAQAMQVGAGGRSASLPCRSSRARSGTCSTAGRGAIASGLWSSPSRPGASQSQASPESRLSWQRLQTHPSSNATACSRGCEERSAIRRSMTSSFGSASASLRCSRPQTP